MNNINICMYVYVCVWGVNVQGLSGLVGCVCECTYVRDNLRDIVLS